MPQLRSRVKLQTVIQAGPDEKFIMSTEPQTNKKIVLQLHINEFEAGVGTMCLYSTKFRYLHVQISV